MYWWIVASSGVEYSLGILYNLKSGRPNIEVCNNCRTFCIAFNDCRKTLWAIVKDILVSVVLEHVVH